MVDAKDWLPSPSPEQPLYGFCADQPCDELATFPLMTVNGYSDDFCWHHARLRVMGLVALPDGKDRRLLWEDSTDDK